MGPPRTWTLTPATWYTRSAAVTSCVQFDAVTGTVGLCQVAAAAGRSAFGAWSLHARDCLSCGPRSISLLGQCQGQLLNPCPPTRPYSPPGTTQINSSLRS